MNEPFALAFEWTPERIEKLTRAWNSGLPTSAIAELIGDGCTKNAVVGKAHRLELPERENPIKQPTARKPSQMPERAIVRRQQARHEQREKESTGKPVTPLAIRPGFDALPLGKSPCRFPMWPHGAEPDGRFCGAPAIEGKPYCPKHASICWTKKADEAA
jgi:GcrA cell cycle regulator